MMLKGLCSFVAFSAAYLFSRSVAIASAVLCLVWLAVFVSYDLRQAARILGPSEKYFSWDRAALTRLLRLAAPVGIVMALVSLNANIPRYAVERFRGSSELGIFAALAYLGVVVGLLANSLGQSAIARLSRSFAAGDTRHFVSMLTRLSLLGVGLGIAGLAVASVCGRTILRLLYRPEYSGYVGLLMVIVATSGVIAVASFLGYGMSAARRFREQVPVTLLTLATCAVGAFLLTPRWGMMGAAVAALVSAIVQLLGSLVVLTKAVRSKHVEAVRSKSITAPDLTAALTILSGVNNE
jgi:O-antigen/teichoic acid export membrane protein